MSRPGHIGSFALHVSVHDVMPATLDGVRRCLWRLEEAGLAPADLLVVPGLDWTPAGLGALRGFVARGHRLAGHGWAHRASRPRGAYHRLHAVLISRDVAEHLSLSGPGRTALMRRCAHWFGAHDLPAPALYVPPAWALGGAACLAALPEPRSGGIAHVEVLTGVHDRVAGRFTRLPLLGFEADTAWRAAAVRTSNRLGAALARRSGVARLAVHPTDFQLRLARELDAVLGAGHRVVDMDEALRIARAAPASAGTRHRRFTAR